jgi:HD-GYP domain-containing protein (c-di-GMP phosphodiesterase class II)
MTDPADPSNLRSRMPSSWLLIALIMGVQFAALIAGAFWFTARIHRHQSNMIREEILANNQHIAGQMARMIDELNLIDLTEGSADWLRLQRLIERSELPNDGFLCVIGADDGRLICHPDFVHNPAVRRTRMGELQLHGPAAGRTLLDATGDDQVAAAGWAAMPDGVHLIAVRNLPHLRAKVLAHQREHGIAAATERFLAPVYWIGLPVAFFVTLLTGAGTWYLVKRYEQRLDRVNAELELLVQRRSEALMKTRDAVIFGLAKLAESRDDETGRHLERIRGYSEILASELATAKPELDDRAVGMIGLTSSLHDIGKVGIPDQILLKPGRFTAQEREVMQKHPLIAGDCLIAIKERLGEDDFLETACEIAFGHHERWDGEGYPFGLRGEQIPLSARIVAVADVYDALRSKRVYKQPMTHEEAIFTITRGAGTQFDPSVVEALIRREADIRKTSYEETAVDSASDVLSKTFIESESRTLFVRTRRAKQAGATNGSNVKKTN